MTTQVFLTQIDNKHGQHSSPESFMNMDPVIIFYIWLQRSTLYNASKKNSQQLNNINIGFVMYGLEHSKVKVFHKGRAKEQ